MSSASTLFECPNCKNALKPLSHFVRNVTCNTAYYAANEIWLHEASASRQARVDYDALDSPSRAENERRRARSESNTRNANSNENSELRANFTNAIASASQQQAQNIEDWRNAFRTLVIKLQKHSKLDI